ncbi:MAG: zf-HC2 domain-containing protein [Candidatus Acidiferrum sp.]
MCEYSGKLIAWLDRELEGGEMAEVERHVAECAECSGQLDAYEQVSKTFDAYCDAMMAARAYRRVPRWMPVAAAAGLAAVGAALFLFLPRARYQPVVLSPSVVAVPAAVVRETAPAPNKLAHHRRHAPPRPQTQNANWLPAERAIQIAIPAESVFPPGAFPEGVTFTADLSIGADGSAEQIRLRPRLIGFERRTTQP